LTDPYAEIAFSPEALRRQREAGSIQAWGAPRSRPTRPDRIGPRERHLLERLETLFLATRTSGGWPYVQHRGGPPGFVHVLDESTIAFVDLPGNAQFVTVANLATDDRICVFCVDFATRTRLKIFGRAVEESDPTFVAQISNTPNGPIAGNPERALLVHVEAVDWNCSRHIRARFDEDQTRRIAQRHAEALAQRVTELELELAELRGITPAS
jgi:predicted pyridoxine 5'-phosphate oxidase superfamily flavin-nucleotide-binding protein